ncbi:MAG: methylamine dehydrogenase accessory protein MauD [Gammaproteobacteria bacterium]
MMEIMIVSNVLLWLMVITLGVLTMALARQIGLLHERSAPLGAVISDKGPEVGDDAPEFELEDFATAQEVKIGGARENGRDLLVLFLAPNCPMCNKLLPTALSMAGSEHLDVVIVSDGPREEHEEYLRTHELGDIPYVVSANVGIQFQVGRVPYAILLSSDGKILSKGLVNTREHLESLVEAKLTGIPTIQEYLKRQKQDHDHHDHAEKVDISSEQELKKVGTEQV